MKKFIHLVLLLIAKATEKEATTYIEYLNAESRILRNKLTLTPRGPNCLST